MVEGALSRMETAGTPCPTQVTTLPNLYLHAPLHATQKSSAKGSSTAWTESPIDQQMRQWGRRQTHGLGEPE